MEAVVVQGPPRVIVWAHIVFNVAVVAGCLLGLLFIWHPPRAEAVQKVFGSVIVVVVASMFLLAGYRTVYPLRRDA